MPAFVDSAVEWTLCVPTALAIFLDSAYTCDSKRDTVQTVIVQYRLSLGVWHTRALRRQLSMGKPVFFRQGILRSSACYCMRSAAVVRSPNAHKPTLAARTQGCDAMLPAFDAHAASQCGIRFSRAFNHCTHVHFCVAVPCGKEKITGISRLSWRSFCVCRGLPPKPSRTPKPAFTITCQSAPSS